MKMWKGKNNYGQINESLVMWITKLPSLLALHVCQAIVTVPFALWYCFQVHTCKMKPFNFAL